MKAFKIFLVLLLFSGFANSQTLPTDPETKKVTVQETVTYDSLSKDEVMERVKEWLTNFYKTSKFDVNDAGAAKVGHNGYFVVMLTYDFKYKSENNVNYNITIMVKDGKYRYTLTDFSTFNTKTGAKSSQPLEGAFTKMNTPNKKEFVTQFTKEVGLITEDLKKYVKSGKPKETNDW